MIGNKIFAHSCMVALFFSTKTNGHKDSNKENFLYFFQSFYRSHFFVIQLRQEEVQIHQYDVQIQQTALKKLKFNIKISKITNTNFNYTILPRHDNKEISFKILFILLFCDCAIFFHSLL